MTQEVAIPANVQQLFLVEVFITPRPVVNDPQGLAVRDGLHQLGYEGIESVRVGKYLRLQLRTASIDHAHDLAIEMCDKLLANPIIEDYRLEVTAMADSSEAGG